MLTRVPSTSVAVIVICVVIASVYGPALNRVFAEDQLWYLAELEGSTSLGAGMHFADYSATRRYWPGDEAVYRPLYYAWLAVANSLFGYHHVWWNTANLILHAGVAIGLFQLLVAIRSSRFALPTAVLFSVLVPSMEMPIWSQHGGFLWAALASIVALRSCVALVQQQTGRPSGRWSVLLAGALFVATLCAEYSLSLAIVASAGVLWAEHRRGRPIRAGRLLLLTSPVWLYAALYAMHIASLTDPGPSVFDPLLAGRNVLAVVPRMASVLRQWLLELAVPSTPAFLTTAYTRVALRVTFSWASPIHVATAAFATGALIWLIRAVSLRRSRPAAPVLLILVLGTLGYVGFLCFARPRSLLLSNSYYVYQFAMLLLLSIYAAIDPSRVDRHVLRRLAAVLAMYVFLHGAGTAAAMRAFGRANAVASAYLTAVERFVDSHRSEPGFSFAVRSHPPDLDPVVTLMRSYVNDPLLPTLEPHVTEILFRPFYNADRPRYIVDPAADMR